MMIIKKATGKNSQILAQIFSVLYSREIKSEGKIKQNIISGKKEYYIGFADNQPIGALSLKFDGKQCELEAIVVKDKGRGTRDVVLMKIVNIRGFFTLFSIRYLSIMTEMLQMKVARIMKYTQLIYIFSTEPLKNETAKPPGLT